MSETLDHYQVLQIDRRADPRVIERVYKTLMLDLKAHPDLGGDEEKARQINAAYHMLKDPERRRQYDAELAQREQTALAGQLAVRDRNGSAQAVVPVRRSLVFDLQDPGKSFRTRCPRCRAEQEVPHRLPFDERLQCGSCHWFYRDPLRELAALRARIARLHGVARTLATKLYSAAAEHQLRAEEAAAAGDEDAARQALVDRRRTIGLLADELRRVHL